MLSRLIWLLGAATLAGSVVAADVTVQLRNDGRELFQHAAEIDLAELSARASRAGDQAPQVMDAEGNPVAAQLIADDSRLLVLVEGLWRTGETRGFNVGWAEYADNRVTDLVVAETDDAVEIDNSYLGVTYPKVGGGGFPREIRFPVSGTVDSGFMFEDRVYEKQRLGFPAKADPTATARVVTSGPLRVTIEQQFRYGSETKRAPGEAGATYRWSYTAHSPVVTVDARITRDGDLDFVWPELHFLQISRDDVKFSRWAGGDPLVEGTLGPESHSVPLDQWGALMSGLDALGMAIEGGLTFWDGTTEYYTYLQRAESWSGPELTRRADLYIGPAREPARIGQILQANAQIAMAVIQSPEERDTVADATLENGRMRLSFARGPDGAIGLSQIEDLGTERRFIHAQTDENLLMWRLNLRDAEGETRMFTSLEAGRCEARVAGDTANFVWADIADVNLTVAVEIRLPEGSDQSLWRIDVEDRGKTSGVYTVQFPLIGGLLEPGKYDLSVPRSNWGIKYDKLTGAQSGRYPSANWPFQMLLANDGDSGLYLACHDPQAWPKQFYLQPGGEFRFEVYAEDAGKIPNGFETPGEVAIGVYEGDWWKGCKMYREWALASALWTRKGPVSQRTDMPDSIKDLALWFIDNHTRDEVVPEMLKAQDFFDLPIGVHWYSWHEVPFDTHYPDYYPTKPGFAEGVKELTDRGILAMPYINGRLHDMDIPSFPEAEPWCTKNESGENSMEVYPSQARQAIMCPYTEYWQKRINGVIERLVHESGVNAVYLDQIAAAWAKLCFDENHGHPVGGGSHWVDGYRELLKQTKEIGRRDGRETVFTTENNAEPYMDGVDAFLIWNPRNEAEIPMMTAVYSGYTLYFSSPRMQSGGPQSFWMGQARDFAWGCQLGWMSPEQFNHAGSVEGMHLKELGQYRVATRKFLTYGELLGELDLRFIGDSGFHTFPLPKVSGTWDNWTGPPQDVTLPAVQTAVWRAEDDTLGMFVVNVSDATLPCELRLDAEAYGGFESEGDWLELKRISPDGTEVAGYMPRAASRRVEVLKPNEVLVYEVAPTQKLPKLAKKADRLGPDAERARWDAWCLIRGFSWSIALPVRVAEGDHVEPSFAADAPPERGLRVRCRGMDDWEPVEGMYPVTLRRAVAGSERLFGGDRLPLAVELGDGQSTVSLTFPWEYTVAPPTEVSIEASNLRAGETSALAVRVRRNAARTGEVVIGLRVPAGWDLDPGPMLSVRDLQRGETRRVWVKVTVPRDAASVAGLEAFVIGERARASVGVDPPRPRAEASQANAPPTVDGDLGEWAEVAAVSLDPGGAREFKEYGGAEDKSGSVRMQWDQQNLYVAIEVRDQAHHQPGRHKDMWQGDCVQIGVRPGGAAPKPGYGGVTELGLALTPSGPEVWKWMPGEGTVDDAQLVAKPTDGGMAYEVAIPWSAIGMTPSVGTVAGLAVTLNDSDGDGFRGWVEWASGLCGAKDAAKFGLLEFK